jgi:hypothetical protein
MTFNAEALWSFDEVRRSSVQTHHRNEAIRFPRECASSFFFQYLTSEEMKDKTVINVIESPIQRPKKGQKDYYFSKKDTPSRGRKTLSGIFFRNNFLNIRFSFVRNPCFPRYP